MQHEIDVTALAESIQLRRKDKRLTVRAAAEEMEHVSHSTLSRVERGNLPDLDTYMRICRWLSVDPSYFSILPSDDSAQKRDSILQKQDIITHLRADKLLTQQTREALITMIEVAYAAARRNILPNEAQEQSAP